MIKKLEDDWLTIIKKEAIFKKALFSHKTVLFNLIRIHQNIKVEDFKDFIFDKNNDNGFNGDISAAFALMHKIKLKNVVFDKGDRKATFKIVDQLSRKTIVCSDRDSNNNELRGQALRDILREQIQNNPDLSLYEGIQSTISAKNFILSRDFVYFLNSYQNFPEFKQIIINIAEDLDLKYQTQAKLSDKKMTQILEQAYKKHMREFRKDRLIISSIRDDHSILAELKAADLSQYAEADNSIYNSFRDYLRQRIDEQYGIYSGRDEEGHWIQDATLASPLEDRVSLKIAEKNTFFLRCLLRTQAVDQAMEKKINPKNIEQITKLRTELKNNFIELIETVSNHSQINDPEMKKLEKKFNTLIMKRLYDANLTGSYCTKKEGSRLLTELCEHIRKSKPYVYTTYSSLTEDVNKDSGLSNANTYKYKDLVNSIELEELDFLALPGSNNLDEEVSENNHFLYPRTP